jgi:DNA-binding CsgD family transcriptional regulator
MSLTLQLEALGAELDTLLDEFAVPLYLVGASGVIRWQNRASIALTGDLRGSSFLAVVVPEYRSEAQTRFSRHAFADDGATDVDVVIVGSDGVRRRVRAKSQAVKAGDKLVGVFGAVVSAVPVEPPTDAPQLTARQHEALRLLAAGRSTGQVAAELGVAVETARNHIRRLMRTLDAHSRIEAVARGREAGLI